MNLLNNIPVPQFWKESKSDHRAENTKACPKHLITMVPYDAKARIACHSSQKGKAVMDACKNGCISCTKCVRTCPNQAIVMTNNLPMIDYRICTDCGACVASCPRKTIQ